MESLDSRGNEGDLGAYPSMETRQAGVSYRGWGSAGRGLLMESDRWDSDSSLGQEPGMVGGKRDLQ